MFKWVVASYEIKFANCGEIITVLKKALEMGKKDVRVYGEEIINFIVGEKAKVQVFVDLREIVVVKKNSKIRIPTYAHIIAKKVGGCPEMVLLGILAKLGIVELPHAIAVAYSKGYLNALATKRGYDYARILINHDK